MDIAAAKDQFQYNIEQYRDGYFQYMQWYDRQTNELIKLHSKQVEALELWSDNTVTNVGFGGAARGGKSLIVSIAEMFDAYIYDGTGYILGRKKLKTLKESTWLTFMRQLYNFGLEKDVDWSFNNISNQFEFKHNKSFIILKNCEYLPSDPESTDFGSIEITKAAIDQSEQVNLKIVDKIRERVGTRMNELYDIKGKVMELFNPSRSHVRKRYWLPYRDSIETDTRKFVRALPTDNPGDEAKRWVKERTSDYHNGDMSEAEYQKQILGNFDYDDDKAILFEYSKLESMFSNIFIEKGLSYLSCDVAAKGSDSFVISLRHGWTFTKFWKYDKKDSTDMIQIINEIKLKYSIPNSRIVIDADGVGMPYTSFFKGCIEFHNGGKSYNKENYENLKTQCYFRLSKRVNKSEINIEDNTYEAEIKEELSSMKQRDADDDGKLKMTKKAIVKASLGRSPDFADSMIMHESFTFKKIRKSNFYATTR